MIELPPAVTVLADIETTPITYDERGLMVIPETVWIMSANDFERDIDYVFVGHEEVERGCRWLETCGTVVFHNGRGFDERVLKKCFNLNSKGKARFLDSIILLRMFYSNQTEEDKIAVKARKDKNEPVTAYTFTGDLVGRHSLEAWGLRVGFPKFKYGEEIKRAGLEPFMQYEEILHKYAVLDTRVLRKIWKEKIAPLLENPKDKLDKAIRIEHWMVDLMEDLKLSGIKFDVDKAALLSSKLEVRSEQLVIQLQKQFPPRVEPEKWVLEPVEDNELNMLMQLHPANEVYRPRFNLELHEGYRREYWGELFLPAVNRTVKNKETGEVIMQVHKYLGKREYDTRIKKTKNKETGETVDEEVRGKLMFPKHSGEGIEDNAYVKVHMVEFNPRSRPQINRRLLELGWEPDEFTDAGNPTTDEPTLQKIEERYGHIHGVADIAKYLMIEKRIGAIKTGEKAWLNLADPEGFLHPTIIPCSAVTMRATHSDPNISQVPSVRNVKVKNEDGTVKTYVNKRGETEEVLRVGYGEEGKWGWDCRSLFTVPSGFNMVGVDLSGIELRCWGHYQYPYDAGALADLILNGDLHGENQRILQLADRRKAKEWLFAMLYGGGDEQLGFILNPTASIPEQERIGRQSKRRFMSNVQGFDEMKSNLEMSVRRRGWLRGIDGRRVPIRKPHAALNTQLQSCGAIISKYWIMKAVQTIERVHLMKWGYDKDYTLLLYSHDEIQNAVRDDGSTQDQRDWCFKLLEGYNDGDLKPWKGEDFRSRASVVSLTCVNAAAEAGDLLGMRLPIAAEAKYKNKEGKFHKHWGDTH